LDVGPHTAEISPLYPYPATGKLSSPSRAGEFFFPAKRRRFSNSKSAPRPNANRRKNSKSQNGFFRRKRPCPLVDGKASHKPRFPDHRKSRRRPPAPQPTPNLFRAIHPWIPFPEIVGFSRNTGVPMANRVANFPATSSAAKFPCFFSVAKHPQIHHGDAEMSPEEARQPNWPGPPGISNIVAPALRPVSCSGERPAPAVGTLEAEPGFSLPLT